jgi:hypothetical protein
MTCLKFLNRVKVNKVEMIFMKFDKQGNVEMLPDKLSFYLDWKLKSSVFWNIMPCSPVLFGGHLRRPR